MGTTIYPTVPVAQPAAEPWPADEHTIRVDEMFARQLDNEFSAGVRGLLHDPETGVAAQSGEAALRAIAGAMPALSDLKERTLAQAMRARIAEVAAFAQRRAERQWRKQQSAASVAALDWLEKHPDTSLAALPWEVRDWLAPDQWDALNRAAIAGRVETDPEVYDLVDRWAVYRPHELAEVDLDRYRLLLDDRDYGRLGAAQQARAEGRTDVAQLRWAHTRVGVDRALDAIGVDTDSPEAITARAEARDWLDSFEAIEGRAPVGSDLDDIARRAVEPLGPDPDSAAEADTGPTDDGQIPPLAGDPNIIRVQGGTGGGGSRGSRTIRWWSSAGRRASTGRTWFQSTARARSLSGIPNGAARIHRSAPADGRIRRIALLRRPGHIPYTVSKRRWRVAACRLKPVPRRSRMWRMGI